MLRGNVVSVECDSNDIYIKINITSSELKELERDALKNKSPSDWTNWESAARNLANKIKFGEVIIFSKDEFKGKVESESLTKEERNV